MKKGIAILLLCVYSCTTFSIGIKQACFCAMPLVAQHTVATSHKNDCTSTRNLNGCSEINYRLANQQDNIVLNDAFTELVDVPSAIHFPAQTNCTAIPGAPVNKQDNPPFHYGLPLYLFNCSFRI